jgi:hypothetical protein
LGPLVFGFSTAEMGRIVSSGNGFRIFRSATKSEGRLTTSRRQNQPHDIAIPLGDGGHKKFNWASEHSVARDRLIRRSALVIGSKHFPPIRQSSNGILFDELRE